ncbi:Diphthamide biosynthesis protein 2 [Coemansia sp. RSA 2618]|nr:Diphthamide biosynthesis protein 2 [Coemansia sp. RSA 2618]
MAELQNPVAIDNDGRAVIERDVEPSQPRVQTSSEAVEEYEIERTAAVITENGYTRVALQFPDELLADATLVSAELQKRVDAHICILADTSYGSCCVDEVAAEHNAADAVVHYGRTCLTLTTRLPVVYVYGRAAVDVDDLRVKGESRVSGQRVLLVSDVQYSHAIEAVAAALKEYCEEVVVSRIAEPGRAYVPKTGTDTEPDTESQTEPGRSWDLDRPIGEYTMLFVGGESLTLTNLMVTQRCSAVLSYDPQTRALREETAKVNRHLSRRYHMVQRARDAGVIGIVVGTLAAVRYLRVVEALKQLVRRAGKKYYVFVVGKLNVAKLANFPEIETYVLVACPENTLVDSREFFQPVVTPYEMLLALSRSHEWTGDYVTDFHAFLAVLDRRADDIDAEDEDDDVPHFSLVTGTLRQARRYNDPRASSDRSLTVQSGNTEIAQYMGSAGAEHLLARSFRGLGHDDDSEDVEPMLAVDGLSGIASKYNHE